jgi:hypothetical protein
MARFFRHSEKRVYGLSELRDAFSRHRSEWGIPTWVPDTTLLEVLSKEASFRSVALKRKGEYGSTTITRYVIGDASPYQIALSLRPRAFLCHGTALFLHGLTDQSAVTIYVNQEQSPKPKPSQTLLLQERINVAFSRAQRRSQMVFNLDSWRIVMIAGKNTGRLEVAPLAGPNGEALDTTKLERTLIDIAVRPAYAGGVYEVLEAYRRARDHVSVPVLIATLKQFDYIYPYHQAIGFYMQRSGYSEAQYSRLAALGLRYDFYLDYALNAPAFDSTWRLYYPQGL